MTQQQWAAVATGELGERKAFFRGLELPMEQVSTLDVEAWLQALARHLPGAAGARLPTEAEWERACRAGTDTRWGHGDDRWDLTRYAWFLANSNRETHPVATLLANPWGLHDVHGNVWEWTMDDWRREYASTAAPNPQHLAGGRVVRGGGHWDVADRCRSAYRNGYPAHARNQFVGFRVLLPSAAPQMEDGA